MPTFDDALRSIDDRFAALRTDKRIPGIAWGVLHAGELVHAGGTGVARDGEDRVPGADTVFRIASMTKSFTAATILLLRDEGRLRLDDPVVDLVPALAAWTPPTADAGPVTIRQLLTMSAGLATDDPWGDRQQDLPLHAFERLLAAGPTFTWPPGTVFDYSNLGYGILGRVVTSAAGAEYGDVVRDRLLRPLGMASSAFHESDVPGDTLAHGYVRRDDDLVREGTDRYGALASMGGIFSTVRDLSRWVGGFLDAFPARSDPEGPHPLRRASRREMQQVQRSFGAEVRAGSPDLPPAVVAGGYGFGLVIYDDPDLGAIVSHSGGYPGFGSVMCWHPATGLGIIALGNLRYAPVTGPATELLAGLVRDGHAVRRAVRPSPDVERYCDVVEGLVAAWDDAVADEAFAMNMDLDEPRDLRRAAVVAVADTMGPLVRDEARPAVTASAAHCRWWLRGERGWAEVEILVTPEASPRIQALRVTAVGDPSADLVAAAERLLDGAEMRGGVAPAWPAALAAAEAVDADRVERSMRAGTARFGRMSLGLPIAGDGRLTTTWDLVTERGGRATLKVSLDTESGAPTEAVLLAAARRPPDDAW
ncbi:MAG TPA: serine hydrolase domain-containing protein [Candidatus Limnocylindrales bacterium]|nr:serine hydrolase domain-containing protein [Candidatus Limnocylindrales bacterium]